ncbi:recombinase family protein [Rickettsia rhipicephali]|uniref:recombinase family protein n=1 Tax=Rickettsia rhipicephali TaxID=33992 RepID=UPI0022516B94|nr:recombinase family protein [Rickettsia rhipicephali]MCX4080055.1 recombinase family protein [Rickettsia rhipicephali]
MGVINAVAQFERDLLIERTQSGLARAKANGKTLGRPQILAELQKKRVIQQLQEGKPLCVSEIITSNTCLYRSLYIH